MGLSRQIASLLNVSSKTYDLYNIAYNDFFNAFLMNLSRRLVNFTLLIHRTMSNKQNRVKSCENCLHLNSWSWFPSLALHAVAAMPCLGLV